MASEVEWSVESLRDVAEVLAYISKRDSPRNALGVHQELQKSVAQLADFPNSKHPFRGRKAELREIAVFQYRVLYRIAETKVRIVAVIHGARNMKKATPGRSFE